MIKKARIKIAFISMIAMLFVTTTLIITINMVNYVQEDRGLDMALKELITQQREKDFLGNFQQHKNGTAQEGKGECIIRSNEIGRALKEEVTKKGNLDAEDDRPNKWEGLRLHERSSAVAQYSGRFAMATITEDNLVTIQSGRPNINNDILNEQTVRSIIEKEKLSGYYDGYKYLVIEDKEQASTYIGFIDCTVDIASHRHLIYISVAVALGALLLSSLFVYYLSGKAVWPLKESMSRQKQFITDAGHELKTPLQAISANMDILAMDVPKNEWVDGTRKQVDKMNKLVADLITLARMEENDYHPVLHKMSASETAQEMLTSYKSVAAIAGKPIVAQVESNLLMEGDRDKIMQLFSILCDNAIKYAPENGTIRVHLYANGPHLFFETENALPKETNLDTEHLFDRFYRGDSARTSDGKQGGYGLGLSIAKAIATSHHGNLTARIRKNGDIRFTASFRLANL